MKTHDSILKLIPHGAIIAAAYAALTLLFAPISYGPMQVRVAEALTILPIFTPAAVPGLFVGCFLANLFGDAVVLDAIFGSLATLLGAAGSWLLRRNHWMVPLPAIMANVVIIPFVLRYGYGVDLPLPLLAMHLAVGEFLGCYVLGEILASALLSRRLFRNQHESA